MKTEVFILCMAAIVLMLLMSVFAAVRKMVISARNKKNNAKILSLPPGKEQCEWVKPAGITEFYTALSSDFRQGENSKVIHRFAR